MIKMRAVVAMLAVAALSACATGAVSGFDARSGAYSREVGPATVNAVEREMLPILQRFGYTIERSDLSNGRLHVETLWQPHEPYPDEREAGAIQARTRVVIMTRPRATTNSSGAVLSGVTIRIEAQHIVAAGDGWRPATPSEQLVEHARDISEAFRLELQVKGMQD